MECRRQMTLFLLVVAATAARASSREVAQAQELMDSEKAVERAKRCVTNTGDDSCANGYLPGAGNDGDYFGGGNTPGKRAALHTLSPQQLRKAWQRCLNTGDDSCANGYIPDAGNDGDYFGGGNTPGKRATLDTLSPQQLRNAWQRCVNTGDDSCANGYIPGAGDDGDYFGSGNTPGKRSVSLFDVKRLCVLFPMSSACRNL